MIITKTYNSPQTIIEDVQNVNFRGNQERASFNGGTNAEILTRKYGWPEGVAMLKQLPGFDKPINNDKKVKRWSEYNGDQWDQERYMDERPFLSFKKKDTGSHKKSRNVEVIVNIGETFEIDAAGMIWKAYAAAKITDELETQGIRVAVKSVSYCQNPSASVQQYRQTVTIKDYQDAVNLSLLVAWLAPWSLRYWTFRARTKHVPRIYDGLGISIDAGSKEGALTIDRGQCLSEYAARCWINEAQETMQKGT